MKKKLTMNNNQTSLRTTHGKPAKLSALIFSLLSPALLALAHCSLLIILLSCEQPFKAGLGPVIDLQSPTIVLEKPVAGAYIRGKTTFLGTAADDYKLDTVWFTMTNYNEDKVASQHAEFRKIKLDGDIYYRITDITDQTGSKRKISWRFTIDTRQLYADGDEKGERIFPDGPFKIRLRVTDAAGKEAVTDEIVFYIKNDIPEIAIDTPSILPGTEEGFLGGDKLNYGSIAGNNGALLKRVMFTKDTLFGRISDDEGIYRGDYNPSFHLLDEDGNPRFDAQGNPVTTELFPPQIRFWQVYFGDTKPVDKEGNTIHRAYKPDEIPSLDQEPWMRLGREAGEVQLTGLNDISFSYPIPDASGSYFAFQVRAQSVDTVHSFAEYPQSYINNFEDASEEIKKENSYVLISIREPLEYPALELYRFEDIYGDKDAARVNGIMKYRNLTKDEITKETIDDDVIADGNHSYIDKTIVSKNGAFKLRMKASHSGGIASAKVYWEKSDRSERGRFIWDWNDRPYTEWKGSIPSRSEPYFRWGLNEPDGGTAVRSFVFTYTDKNPRGATDSTADYDRVGDHDDFGKNTLGDFRRISKVQKYIGSTTDPETGRSYELDELLEGEKWEDNWENVFKLNDGTYNIYVYATSSSGTRVATPFVATLSIDREKPAVELNYIEGSAKEEEVTNSVTNKKERLNTVNGVIRPRFIMSDSQPTDTGFRTGTKLYFQRPGLGGFYQEQAYILILESDRQVMDEYLTKHSWPEFPNLAGAAPVITRPNGGDTIIRKHGPIENSSCLFKTSKIYNKPVPPAATEPPEPDALADGDYRLYVFARDNAFNVQSDSWPIKIMRSSDDPTFDFTVDKANITTVTEPDAKYDFPASTEEKSFLLKDNGKRNIFTANSFIRVRLKDDDSLDLGVQGGAASGIEVSIMGSTTVNVGTALAPKWETVAWDDAKSGEADKNKYRAKLSDTDVKKAFPPQSLGADNTTRIPVKEITGTIDQEMLVKSLIGNTNYNYLFTGIDKAKTTILPDGIYRVKMSIKDYSPAKLITPTDLDASNNPKPADFVEVTDMPVPPVDKDGQPSFIKDANGNPVLNNGNYQYNDKDKDGKPIIVNRRPPYTKEFWIAVDSKQPEIKLNTNDNTAGGIIVPGNPEPLKGTVSDENGPITLLNWRVLNGNKVERDMLGTVANPASDAPRIVESVSLDAGKLKPGNTLVNNRKWKKEDYTGGKWVNEFEYWIDMNGRETGAYDFVLIFQDRFGNTSTVTHRLSVDSERPKVSLIKKIETFERDFADVEIDAAWPKLAADSVNRKRLAVKVVNFTINATDNNGIEGVRWWLLPANVRADTGFTTVTNNTGIVTGYNSWPASYTGAGFDVKEPGTYYGGKTGSFSGFDKGAFGVVDVKNRKFTIAIDSERLANPNGEYRLHIIARDNAGLTSDFVSPAIIPNSYVFQEVFFLQREDKPYVVKKGITPGYIDPAEAAAGLGWPKKIVNGAVTADDYAPDVLGGLPVVRGTIWENNGFFNDQTETTYWPGPSGSNSPPDSTSSADINTNVKGSITIWFSGSAATLPNGWETLVANGSTIPNYTKKEIPNGITGSPGLGKQGRNMSLTIALTELFADELKEDGRKRYIVKATDSPVNKLWYGLPTPAAAAFATESMPGTPMGTMATKANNEGVRENNFWQFAFIYDATPPKVIIDNPEDKKTFGKTFADNFMLGGSIADANLSKTNGVNGDYFFDYYVNNDTKKRFTLKPRTGVNINAPILVNDSGVPCNADGTPSGQALPTPPTNAQLNADQGKHIYMITKDLKGKITVYFRVGSKEVAGASGIIPYDNVFTKLSEGQNTLYLSAADLSGKEGMAWVNFIKDVEPPVIAFSNLDEKPYDKTNNSKVDKDWWTKTQTARRDLLFGDKLPLTTIYYEPGSGLPELRGTITDLVSNIKLTVASNSNVGTGDVNSDAIPNADPNLVKPASSFKYWIDNETTPRYLALIDGAGGKSVRWTILLTNNGQRNGTPLYDGVHTIVLTAADDAGEEITDTYMIAFRIDSKSPAKPSVKIDGKDITSVDIVYGNTAYQNDQMFTLKVTGNDANLNELRLVVKNTTTGEEEKPEVFGYKNPTWTYYYPGVTPLPPSVTSLTEDYILFSGDYSVPKSLFKDSGKYDVKISAYDTFKNKSEEFVFQFTYDKDRPKIEFTQPPDENKNTAANLTPRSFIVINNGIAEIKENVLTPNNKINRLTSSNLRIQGSVSDTFSAIRQVQSEIYRWDWENTGWVVVEAWRDVQNYSTNTQTQVSWTKNLLGQNNETETDPAKRDLDIRKVDSKNPSGEGLYRIRIQAKDASEIKMINGGNTGWTYPSGQGNPVISDYMYFYFDRTNPELKLEKINGDNAELETYYSKPPAGGFKFAGTVSDDNRFAKIEVKFTAGSNTEEMNVTMSKVATLDPTISFDQGAKKQAWEAAFKNPNQTLPDGKYRVTMTVYDMTGRYTTETKSFILDGTPPTVKFTLPAKVQNKGYGDDSENPKPTPPTNNPTLTNGFASVIVNGGPTAVITGETGDKPGSNGEPGSQSGVDQMWFRLGYIDGTASAPVTQFPTKDAIEADEISIIVAFLRNAEGLTEAAARTRVAAMTVKQRNEWMDKVADYRATGNGDGRGNAWFKLGGKIRPTGFVINNPNIYDWRFEIPENLDPIPVPADPNEPNYLDHLNTSVNGKNLTQGVEIEGLKLYSGTITVKGRTYEVGSSAVRQMVRAVDGQSGGIYRLPLWVRLTDIAGNVGYYCHDIWFDANGSIPSTSIESPSNGTQYNARGGTITVDGVARHITSVYDVIFRVYADSVADTNLDGIQTNVNGTLRPTNTNKLTGTMPSGVPVRIQGYNSAPATTVAQLPAVYQTPNNAQTPNGGWQKANLTLPGGTGETVVPWSIMLNAEDQLQKLIPTNGTFIRVWLEVFVLNGTNDPLRTSIYPNDGLGTGNGQPRNNTTALSPLYGTVETPKPYVRSFYINKTAPAITEPNVGTWNNGTTTPNLHGNFTWGAYKGAGQEMRSNRFAFGATLDPNPLGDSTTALGEVSYRVKRDNGDYGEWVTVWKTGINNAITADAPFNNGRGVSISVRDTPQGKGTRYWFDYAIDTKNADSSKTAAELRQFTEVPGIGNRWQYTGGTITVQIRMKDNSPQPIEAEQIIQVGIDNFTPLNDEKFYGNKKVAGTNAVFQGRVYDYANPTANAAIPDSMNTDYTPRKLKRVSVWFTKQVRVGTQTQTHFVNMNQKNTTVQNLPQNAGTTEHRRTISVSPANTRTSAIPTGQGGVNDTVNNITVTNRGDTAANVTYPGLGTLQEWNADYVRDITPATGQPSNKMLWAPVNSANHDVRWQFTLDSTLLPDGELTLHYIVVDEADNASYYTQTGISVRNNYPEITRVTLYTDNNGQGAQYTMDDKAEYALNDYRGKMFANYTDSSDYTAPAATGKLDSVGYLNSGFISKNRYIGFKVETDKGNRPLKFRLQHVTRERIPLSKKNLQDMVTAKTTGINLYTIAWHGNYTPDRWRAIGVPVNTNPTLGTHFIFTMDQTAVNELPADPTTAPANGILPEVWRYKLIVGRDDITNYTGAGQTEGSTTTVEYGPTEYFDFNDPTNSSSNKYFNYQPKVNATMADRINEFDGSHPTEGDTKPDKPKDTAFFLIRVWDSIDTTTGAAVDEQLYDALVIGMNVYLTDSTKPVVRLYDLNPYTETKVIENNEPQTIREAANPTAIGSNIVRGGLFNAGSARAMVRSGFIDPRNGTTALSPVNGVYDKDGRPVNKLALPDYPLKVASDSPATGNTYDKVSGRIILRGHAWDDQLIDTITLTLGTSSKTILRLDTVANSPTRGKMVPDDARAFVIDELHWKTGHSVEWAYVWDTETEPSGTGAGGPRTVQIQVSATDKNGPNTSNPPFITSDSDTAFRNQTTVEVVPYITGLERRTPDFTTKRSLQGWYSFYQGETGIKINGYNFGTTAGTISLGGTAMQNVANGSPANKQRVFDMPTSTSAILPSGAILMTVGSNIEAYNNKSTTAGKSWNKENSSFTPGSDLWVNKPYAHIWRSLGSTAAQAEGTGTSGMAAAGTVFAQLGTSSGLDSPGMALQYTGTGAGRLHGMWTVYGRESIFYAQNTGTKPQMTAESAHSNSTQSEGTGSSLPTFFGLPGALLLVKAGEPYSDGDIDYYNPADTSRAPNNEYTNNTSVVAAYQRDGEPYLILKPRLASVIYNNSGSSDGGGGDAGYYLTRQDSPRSTYRWKNTRIKKADVSTANNNPGKVFVSAYDSTTKRLFFKTVNGTINASGSPGTNDDNGGTALYLDGGGTLTGNIGGIAASTQAGNWSAIDYTSDGRPVVAYFDEQNQTLRLAYASTATPTSGNNWTRRYVIPAETGPGSELRRGSGSYVSMKIDRDRSNRIHLAFYNSTNKAVVYATAAYADATSTNASTADKAFTVSVIDRVVEGGQWTDISVDKDGNPWIVYADSARLGNKDGARIAYRSYSGTGAVPANAFGRELKDPISGNLITGWEALTMPADYNVKNDRLNIAAWPPTGYTGDAVVSPIGSWNAAVGYTSDQFRVGYFVRPSATSLTDFPKQ